MMAGLEEWARAATRPPGRTLEEEAEARAEAAARKKPLVSMERSVEVRRFMGRWFVAASIGTPFEQGMMNCVEEYAWDEERGRVDVQFAMQANPTAGATVLAQRMTPTNDLNTSFRLVPKVLGLWSPVGFTYLLLEMDPDYEACMVGVPDRSYLWLMTREAHPAEETVQGLLERAKRLGYDPTKIKRVTHETAPENAPEKATAEEAPTGC
mmetsp:Transcript_51251/g.116512  ORF Transcript_51251/g.116512 Transcript_51251/m.116512 type:complete len:210 (+) Transcript_51251:439-1068(+)